MSDSPELYEGETVVCMIELSSIPYLCQRMPQDTDIH